MIVTKKQINTYILFVFLLVCVFFPADPYNLKLIALFLLLLLNASLFAKEILKNQFRTILIFGFLFPLIIMLQSILLTGNFGTAISSAYSPIILLLLIPIIDGDIKFKDQVIFLLKAMSVCILLIAILDLVGVINVNSNNFIRNAFYTYGMGVMGKSVAYSSYYRIFFNASPLILILLVDSISKKKYLWVVISFAALWFSGTRANVFSALIILLFSYVISKKNKVSTRVLISLAIILLSILNFSRIYSMISGTMNTSGSVASDLIRSGLIKGYLEAFSDPFRFIFGYGFGSAFYNYGRDSIGYTSELSYFEMIRCVGIIFAVPFFYFVIKPVFSKQIPIDFKIAYICYLIIAATNPLLFSSTAMILYMYFYEDIIRNKSLDKDMMSTQHNER